jgi:hypothetical protein
MSFAVLSAVATVLICVATVTVAVVADVSANRRLAVVVLGGALVTVALVAARFVVLG